MLRRNELCAGREGKHIMAVLYLTRYPKEKIILWQDGKVVAKIVVDSVSDSGEVKLGVSAPRALNVDREELYERKRKEVESGNRAEFNYNNRG